MKTELQTASERITAKGELMPASGLNPWQAQQVMQPCKLWGSKQEIVDSRGGINSEKLTLRSGLIEESKDGVEQSSGRQITERWQPGSWSH